MSISIFDDVDRKPSEEEVMASLGDKRPLWEELFQFILKNYELPGTFRFGGKKSGWELWYRKSGKSLVTLYPQKDGFTALIVIGPSLVDDALKLSLGENAGSKLKAPTNITMDVGS